MDSAEEVEQAAIALLEDQGTTAIPTPVERIAYLLGIRVVYQPLDNDVSGLLYCVERYRGIGVNADHGEAAPARPLGP